eukprot:352622-Chlamydomonas_euryale.AAC.4
MKRPVAMQAAGQPRQPFARLVRLFEPLTHRPARQAGCTIPTAHLPPGAPHAPSFLLNTISCKAAHMSCPPPTHTTPPPASVHGWEQGESFGLREVWGPVSPHPACPGGTSRPGPVWLPVVCGQDCGPVQAPPPAACGADIHTAVHTAARRCLRAGVLPDARPSAPRGAVQLGAQPAEAASRRFLRHWPGGLPWRGGAARGAHECMHAVAQ